MLKGEFRLVFRNKETLSVEKEVRSPNLVVDRTLQDMLVTSRSNSTIVPNISISTMATAPSKQQRFLDQIIGTAYTPSGVTYKRFVEDSSTFYVELQQRIDSLPQSRQFSTVGLTNAASASQQNNILAAVYALTLLQAPCTQAANQILDIYYRVQFIGSNSQKVTSLLFKAWLWELFNFNVSDSRQSVLHATFAGIPDSNFPYNFYQAAAAIAASSTMSISNVWTTQLKVNSHYKVRREATWGQSEQVGLILNSMQAGASSNSYPVIGIANYCLLPLSKNLFPQQSAFTHRDTSNSPFFNSLTLATGTGTVSFGGNWSPSVRYPKIYRIKITSSGSVGTATYKLATRLHLGFVGNTWTNREVNNIYRHSNSPAFANARGYRSTDKQALALNSTEVIHCDSGGVTILNVLTGAYRNWDSSTTPALPVTNLGQIELRGTDLYVACRNTGLYQIDTTTNAVTQLSNTPCYGVASAAGFVYALFSGRLSRSDNWNAALTFSFTGISDNNWSNCRYLKADPVHPNNRLCIAGSDRIVWWENSTSVATVGYVGSFLTSYLLQPYNLGCSPSGDFWVAASIDVGFSTSSYKMTFNSNSLVTIGSGNIACQGVMFDAEGNYLSRAAAYNSALSSVKTYSQISSSQHLSIYLGKGIGYFGNFLRYLFDGESAWEEYGWNGSAWVLGNANSRTCQSTPQALLDGVTVAFANGASSPHFVQNDYYLGYFNDGLLKTNVDTCTWSYNQYAKPAQFDNPISGTVPSSAPHQLYVDKSPFGTSPEAEWVTAECDSLSEWKVFANSVPLTPVAIADAVGTMNLNFKAAFDSNGLFYILGSTANNWTNPGISGKVTVVPSSSAGTAATAVTGREESSEGFYTGNAAGSYIGFDLGAGNTLIPQGYWLQNSSSSSVAIRNFKVQGSNNVSANTVAGFNAATWVDLDVRNNDTSLPISTSRVNAYFPVTGVSTGYRWLRLLNTGFNSDGVSYNLFVSRMEFYGVLTVSAAPSVNPGEVGVNQFGLMVFNPAQAGATLSGSYTYIRN